MLIFDHFPMEEILFGCFESIKDLPKQFELISALVTVVAAVISLLELRGAFVNCTIGNVPASHDINKN